MPEPEIAELLRRVVMIVWVQDTPSLSLGGPRQ
jgi:hypothetical protein